MYTSCLHVFMSENCVPCTIAHAAALGRLILAYSVCTVELKGASFFISLFGIFGLRSFQYIVFSTPSPGVKSQNLFRNRLSIPPLPGQFFSV